MGFEYMTTVGYGYSFESWKEGKAALRLLAVYDGTPLDEVKDRVEEMAHDEEALNSVLSRNGFDLIQCDRGGEGSERLSFFLASSFLCGSARENSADAIHYLDEPTTAEERQLYNLAAVVNLHGVEPRWSLAFDAY